MDCLVMPVSLIRRRSTTGSRFGYKQLTNDGLLDHQDSDNRVTVVVGKNKKVFLVDPNILQENPFQVLMNISMKKDPTKTEKDNFHFTSTHDHDHERVIFVDVDDILFEHMLWLMNNDTSSLFQLNLKDIVDFYM
ncbi:uncharacterized protein LOC123905236 [Trifolium pratense]|uniref:uncharacterized protein LOC123905236 n=1 Tax=Trifolium pratense TaxID=57577 RepID=UPI001E6942A2|nr:uncharacterized protein LOC123905236 [Trifolium pratense]